METGAASSGNRLRTCHRLRRTGLVLRWSLSLLLAPCSLPAQQADFDKTSTALRTALHYDPSVEVPLQKLIELYRGAGRMDELLALYQQHLAQYPDDMSATLVLARLYGEIRDKRAGPLLRDAITRRPDDALLAWQHGRFLEGQHDPKSVEEMARAVSLETSAARRTLWFGELMKAAAMQGREDLVLARSRQFIADGSMPGEQRLRWARQALASRLVKTAALLLEGIDPKSLGADGEIESAMLRARVLAASQKADEAAATLDAMLDRLAPDHWRRRELISLRIDVTSEGASRDQFIASARAKWQAADGRTESNALTLAEVLQASHRGREALQVLREAAAALPTARQVETRLLDAWEKEGVDAEALAWLEALLAGNPDRGDLQLRRVRWLFSSGRGEAARSVVETLLAKLPPEEQVTRSVELARWLRRRNQLSDASALLETALARTPERWDLRRELAEMLFAQRRAADAAKLFSGAWSSDLPSDARLEVTQFLLVKQLWLEAKALLEPWLAKEPGAFEGQLLLVKILDKLGDDARVLSTLEQARTLCDTEARYQAWLETAAAFAESREQTEGWLESEASRLSNPADAPAMDAGSRAARWLALVSQAESQKAVTVAEKLLSTAMKQPGMPDAAQLAFEKARLELLANDTSRVTETEAGLRKLIEEDAAHREDHRARLALLYERAGRTDLSSALLAELDAAQCSEPDALRALQSLCRERGLMPQALACAEKLVQLEPGERAHWSQWLGLLAEAGDEVRFRAVVRETLGRAHDWKLDDAVPDQLRRHLVASQWRSVLAELLAGDDAEHLSAARHAAAGLMELDLLPEQQRWADWLVGLLSAKLRDTPAVESSLAKLGPLDAALWLPFPDGFELSVEQARAWLRQTSGAKSPRDAGQPVASSSLGPLPPFDFRWGFALEEGRSITRVSSGGAEEALIFIADDRNRLHAVDAATGKLRWRWQPGGSAPREASRSGNLPLALRSTAPPYGSYRNGIPELRTPLPFAVGGGRVCVLHGDQLQGLDTTTGMLLWRSDLGGGGSAITMSPLVEPSHLAVAGTRVIVWQPRLSRVSGLNLATGKLEWETTVPAPPAKTTGNSPWSGFDSYAGLKSGMSVDDGQVFVFSQTAALLDAERGRVLWRLSAGELPGFPIDLEVSSADSAPVIANVALGPPQRMVIPGASRLSFGRPSVGAVRWAFGNPVTGILQSGGSYGACALVHDGQVWTLGGGGMGAVSTMGLPKRLDWPGGTVLGFAGGALVSWSGNSVMLRRKADRDYTMLFDSAEATTATTASLSSSVALRGTRVHAVLRDRLQVADARSGVTIADVALPAELASWAQSMQPAVTPAAVTVGGMRRPSVERRVWIPQGIMVSDDRGGGSITGVCAVVTGRHWIFPVNERAVAGVTKRE